jgi:hypothetical protein
MYGQQSQLPPATKYFLDALGTGDVQMKTPDGADTVFAQKMQQGIAQGLPQMQGMQGAKQDYAAAAPSVLRNMEQEKIQRMMQEAMRPKPVGIEGVQSNIRPYREGGIIGYSGLDGSVVDTKLMRMTPEEYERRRREAMARGVPPERIRRTPEEEVIFSGLSAVPPMQEIPVPEVVSAPVVAPEAQRLMDRQRVPAPRPPAQRPPAPAPVAPTGVAAALAQRPTYDTAGIAAAGTPYTQAGEGDVRKIREAEGKRAEFEKTLPDLSAKGIAALQQRMRDVETAEAARKENLGLDRVIQQLLGRAQGAGGAARADIQFMNAQRAAEDAFSQARLGNQQAQLLLEKAQQERQLGRFDRAIALEKEAATRMEKARDDALKAQQIAQATAAAQYQGAVQMRGDDIQAATAAANRAAQREVDRTPPEVRLMEWLRDPKNRKLYEEIQGVKQAPKTRQELMEQWSKNFMLQQKFPDFNDFVMVMGAASAGGAPSSVPPPGAVKLKPGT